MAQIKVNINKPDPSKEAIHKYKNYNSFLETYQQLHTPNGIGKMFYRDKVKLSMIVVFIMLLLIYLFADLENPEKEEEAPAPIEDSSSLPTPHEIFAYDGQTIKDIWT